MVEAQVVLDRGQFQSLQTRFLQFVAEVVPTWARAEAEPMPVIKDTPAFLCGFLEWSFDDIYGLDPSRPLPDALTVPLPEF